MCASSWLLQVVNSAPALASAPQRSSGQWYGSKEILYARFTNVSSVNGVEAPVDLGVVVVAFPVYVTLIASTQTSQQIVQTVPMSLAPGGHMLETYRIALFGGESSYGSRVAPVAPMMWVSLVSALVISLGKIAISLLSAFAFVYFRFPGRGLCFWMVFVTLMLPVEVRIFPTYQVVSDLRLLNTYAGLTVPLIFTFWAFLTLSCLAFAVTATVDLAELVKLYWFGPMVADRSTPS